MTPTLSDLLRLPLTSAGAPRASTGSGRPKVTGKCQQRLAPHEQGDGGLVPGFALVDADLGDRSGLDLPRPARSQAALPQLADIPSALIGTRHAEVERVSGES